MRTSRAYYRVGLSGTPEDRSDRRTLLIHGALGKIVYSIPAQLLVEKGIISQPHIRMVKFDDPTAVDPPNVMCWLCRGTTRVQDPILGSEECSKCRGKGEIPPHPSKRYRALVAESAARNELVMRLIQIAAKPCMVFVEWRNHGLTLLEDCRRSGFSVEFAEGSKRVAQRKAIERRLRDGDLEVCISTRVFQEGIDVPNVASVVRAAAMKTGIAALQQLGRGSRVTVEKTEFEVWDIFDRYPDQLVRQARARKKAYEKHGYAVDVVRQSDVFALEPA